MSEQVSVYIKEVTLVDFKGFRGEHKFSFVDEKGEWCRWTVFLGNNNTGKTNLLKAIANLEPEPTKNADAEKNTNDDYIYYPSGFNLRNIFIPDQPGLLGLEMLFPETHEVQNFYYRNNIGSGIMNSKLKHLLFYGYGVIREIDKKGISSENKEILNASNLFNNTKLVNFEDWLFQLDYAANNMNADENNRRKALEKRNLLTSVLKSEIFPEINDIQFISDENLENYIEFKTEDGWHKMSELGYGYQATLSWMADFCKKMFDRYPDSSNPLKEPAVLLIDEIDLHLHPQWQRGLIQSLSDIFPQTQFIVTTHSPFIIQSMENVNLYTLNRVGDHTEVKHLGNRSYIGWKIEEILSEVMGLDDKIHTDRYNELIAQFDEALDNDDYAKGKGAYDQLMLILHPQSAERKLLDIQFTQLTPTE
jgi:predicted ATP-binding protein involved in virulence